MAKLSVSLKAITLTRFRHYPSLLAALYPLFSPDEEDGVRDNAAAAVARMILACPGTIPLPQVLPVFLGALPLKDDLEEAGIVYGCLFTLIGHSPNEVRIRVVPRHVFEGFPIGLRDCLHCWE